MQARIYAERSRDALQQDVTGTQGQSDAKRHTHSALTLPGRDGYAYG